MGESCPALRSRRSCVRGFHDRVPHGMKNIEEITEGMNGEGGRSSVSSVV
jgi:hypothetical protein